MDATNGAKQMTNEAFQVETYQADVDSHYLHQQRRQFEDCKRTYLRYIDRGDEIFLPNKYLKSLEADGLIKLTYGGWKRS